MKKLIEALKEQLDKHPGNGVAEFKDIGAMLDKAFQAAGYELQLHQHGISGVSVIAVKVLPEITINVQSSQIEEAA